MSRAAIGSSFLSWVCGSLRSLTRAFWIHLALALCAIVALSCDFAVSGGLRAAGLEGDAPTGGPEEKCVHACEARASRCTHHQCVRGCNFVLDRLVQHEGPTVIACVARTTQANIACDDHTWATCGTRIGLYADGGPPAPPPSRDDDDEEEEE